LTGLFLLLYGIGRFFNEQYRWYEREMVIVQTEGFRLTFSQIISLVMILAGLALIAATLRKPARQTGQTS
jgi:prolipoprotein diacylglyceryltransferase